MSEQKIIEQAIKQFFDEPYQDGDVISHDWLKVYLEIPEPRTIDEARSVQFLVLSRVEEFKEALLKNHKIALESIRGIGYRIVPPNEQAMYAVDEAARHIQRGIERGIDVLDNARLDKMSDESRRRHIDAQIKMSGLKLIVVREKRDVFALFRDNKKPA